MVFELVEKGRDNLENVKYGGYALSLRHSSKQNVGLVTRYIESFNAPVRSSNIP